MLRMTSLMPLQAGMPWTRSVLNGGHHAISSAVLNCMEHLFPDLD